MKGKAMGNHWLKAQEIARREGGDDVVRIWNGRVCIAADSERGWIIFSMENNLQLVARTTQGVELALEELMVPPLGWM